MEALSLSSLVFPTIPVSRSKSNYRPIKCAAQPLPLVDNADKFLEASKKGNV
ncbi:anthranilate synthase component I-2 chloroplastic-like, partial [Trifolium medium]|nr:anthranilate synthase component I-2 chloroplastic-like [Trifolium medium]